MSIPNSPPRSETSTIDSDFAESLLAQNCKKYNRISLDTRDSLLGKIFFENKKIKIAAKELNMNYSTAKTILHLYRKKQKKAGKKIKEENRCQYKKITQIEENNLEVIVTQGGKIMQKNKESLLVKPICKGRSQEEELKYMNYQYQLKLMLSQYKTIQNQPVATNLTQKAEIKPSQILFNPNNKINNFSLKNCDTNCNVKKNVIIIKAVEDKRLTV